MSGRHLTSRSFLFHLISSHVSRLLSATPESEDPVSLLKEAARDHIPVNPSSPKENEKPRVVPDPQHRPSVKDVIAEIEDQDWYIEQIIYRREFEEKSGQNGQSICVTCSPHLHHVPQHCSTLPFPKAFSRHCRTLGRSHRCTPIRQRPLMLCLGANMLQFLQVQLLGRA